jgi:SAM-dependent methyltransferase
VPKGGIRIGDIVAVFALGPIGLCAAAGARLMGATAIIGVDSIPERLAMARALGVDHTVDFKQGDPTKAIMALTDGRGVDVAIEALGTQATFEGALRVLRPGGTLSSLGVYSSDRPSTTGVRRRRRRGSEQVGRAGPDIRRGYGPVLQGFGRGNRRGCAKGKDQQGQADCQEVVHCCLSASAIEQAPRSTGRPDRSARAIYVEQSADGRRRSSCRYAARRADAQQHFGLTAQCARLPHAVGSTGQRANALVAIGLDRRFRRRLAHVARRRHIGG